MKTERTDIPVRLVRLSAATPQSAIKTGHDERLKDLVQSVLKTEALK